MKRFFLILILSALNAPLFVLLYRKLFASSQELKLAVKSWFGPYYDNLEDRNKQQQEITAVIKLLILLLSAIALIWIELELLLFMGV